MILLAEVVTRNVQGGSEPLCLHYILSLWIIVMDPSFFCGENIRQKFIWVSINLTPNWSQRGHVDALVTFLVPNLPTFV
jgi:hypothetical protein